MSNLSALVYVSSAIYSLNYDEIDHLLTRARERNDKHGITGVLLYIGGNFMQYIEGPTKELDLIYQIIKNDPLHTGLIQLYRSPIEQREFDSWAMAYCTKDRTVLVEPGNNRTILLGKLGGQALQQTPSRLLLHNFWTNNSP